VERWTQHHQGPGARCAACRSRSSGRWGERVALAKRLEQYRHETGFPSARFWTEPVEERIEKIGSYEIYRVASNLVNGLPPRYRDQDSPPEKQ
jgi:hypothetical protein